MLDAFLTAFVTMFVLIDPIGVTPMFAALTAGADRRARLAIGLRAVLVAAFLILIFGLAGERLLGALGISLSAFRVAGGLMLFLVAVEMLFQRRTARREAEADRVAQLDNDPSVFPLGMPLIAGPGTLAAIMLLSSEYSGAEEVAVFAAAGCVLVLSFVAFALTGVIERVLGETGIRVITRVFGMLLGALAVQFIFDGLIAFLDGLGLI